MASATPRTYYRMDNVQFMTMDMNDNNRFKCVFKHANDLTVLLKSL